MTTLRSPAVAGTFYPKRAADLTTEVRKHLGAAAPRPPRASRPDGGRAKAIIVPHAGYVFSGPVAASAFRCLEEEAADIRRIVLLGPNHRLPVKGLALPGVAGFETPLGIVPLDQQLVERVADMTQVSVNAAAHGPEHSLEVELPFLQAVLPSFKVLPLLVGTRVVSEVAQVLDRVWGGPETRIVVSSDLSHYLRYDFARQIDRQTADQILALEAGIGPQRACGGNCINGLLAAARRRNLKPELLDLRSSGDTAGDRSQVVGYGAFAFYEAA